MSEREKTLKEKASDLEVELARVYDELRSRYSYDAARVVSQARLFIHERTKALTALEKRVEELEKERALVEKWAEGYFRLNGYQDLIAMLKEREAPDAE